MAKNPTSEPDESEKSADLTQDEDKQVQKRASVDSTVVHEVIRQEGHSELARPAWSLFWSGLAAGVAICVSVMCKSLLHDMLPDTPWRPAVSSIGYTVGFLIVILGRMQLFTESTLSATIPAATMPTLKNIFAVLKLWSIVLFANLLGTLAVALLVNFNLIGFEAHQVIMIEVSREILHHDFSATLKGGIPAGFLLAAVAWSLPVGRGQEFLIIFFFTYFIGLGGFSHVIAGSLEAWLLALSGEAGFKFALLGFILPAFIGNVIGGTFMFATLAHAPVRNEMK